MTVANTDEKPSRAILGFPLLAPCGGHQAARAILLAHAKEGSLVNQIDLIHDEAIHQLREREKRVAGAEGLLYRIAPQVASRAIGAAYSEASGGVFEFVAGALGKWVSDRINQQLLETVNE